MDSELDAVFTAEVDEEFANFPGSEQPDITENHDTFFSHRFDAVVREENGKKGNCCLNCLKELWTTRNKKIFPDKGIIIKTTVRELLIYTGFIIIILTIALLPTTYLQTYFFTSIMQQFAFSPDSSYEEAFTAIRDRPAMWSTIYLLPMWEWFRKITCCFDFPNNHSWSSTLRFILSSFLTSLYDANTGNRLVGRPRIRQVRVAGVDCRLPSSVLGHLRHCFPTFSVELENRDPIVPAINESVILSKLAWRWRSASESGCDRVLGTVATYTGSGYYLDLSLTNQTTFEMLTELYTNLWTSESTRAIIIDFTLYNANLDFFSVVQVLFETPYTGGVIASVDIRPLYLIRGQSLAECIVFGCEIVSLFFVAYYIVKEIISAS
ncbi:Polycystin-2 [Taenia crassiceps]|uniref:Polycystin-2 n=1 Tax=Taenia crassiceps TaxID=6207 RepID=A0ABR4PZM0_9CEST